MAWCPVCKCEYKKGITKCAECKVDLVDSLEEKAYEPIFEQEDKEAYDSLGFKEVTENKNIHFIDIPRFVVYNSLVYVLMEFRGHT